MKKIQVFLITLAICFIPANLLANFGAWYENRASAFQALPLKSDAVEVLHEDLIIDTNVRNYDGEYYPTLANVTAKYTLKNVTDEKAEYSIAFPHSFNIMNFDDEQYLRANVKLNGNKIDYKAKVIPGITSETLTDPDNDISFENILSAMNQAVDEEDFKYPTEAEFDQNTDFYSNMVRLILFEITLEPGKTYDLEVGFYQMPSSDRLNTAGYKFTYDYYMEPAKYWKAFGDIDITVKLTSGYEIIDTSMLFGKGNNDTYTAHYDYLPTNLSFTIYPSQNFFEKISDKMSVKARSSTGWLIFFVIVMPLLIIALLIFIIVVSVKAVIKSIKNRRTRNV
ncbi:MAG TPA: hypothetical protein VHT96_18495 [Clostridia bacterium]|nr:hypothetical protein [Clostridia bacterium]